LNLNFPFASKTLYETYSSLNGQIEVVEIGSRRRLTVGNFNYSLFSSDLNDLFLDRYWGKMVKGIKNRRENLKQVLILGLGGGTFAFLLNHYFSPQVIEGVEIDPQIIEIGCRYFYLSQFANLTVHLADAADWVRQERLRQANAYDLIIFDLYQAVSLPPKCEREDFLKASFELLTSGGMAVFNRVCCQKEKEEIVDRFCEEKLRPFFATIKEDLVKGALGFNNYIVYAQKKGA